MFEIQVAPGANVRADGARYFLDSPLLFSRDAVRDRSALAPKNLLAGSISDVRLTSYLVTDYSPG